MEIAHDFSPDGDPDPEKVRLAQLELLLGLYQQALGHDLPNQMVILTAFLGIVETELGPDVAPESRGRIGQLAMQARQAGEYMRALAAVGRLGRQPGAVETLDLGELFREAAVEAKLLFKGQEVDYHLQQDMPLVTTSRAPLYQVVHQLLRNAFQAAVAGRSLVLEIGARRLEIGGIEMHIRDNGRGMTECQLGQIRTKLAGEPGSGPGLGLIWVRQIVTGWRGTVRIASEPGEGVLVTILARTL